MADQLRVDYDQMNSIMGEFTNESQHVEQLYNNTSSAVDDLVGKGWQGDAADKFNNEMVSEILPALKRLGKALETGANVCKQIIQTVQAADEDASSLFKNSFK